MMQRRLRITIIVVGGVVALNLLGMLVESLTGPDPTGRPSSSYATIPEGLAAYASLLERHDSRVTPLRGALEAEALDPESTLVVMDGELSGDEVLAVRGFVERGGRLVAGGRDTEGWLGRVLGAEITRAEDHVDRAHRAAPLREVETVGEVVAGEPGVWEETGPALPVLAGDDGTFAAVAKVGDGRVVLLGSGGPLRNARLGEADNAAFGLAIAGAEGRPVSFAEGIHGFGREEGLAAVPARWRWAAGLLLLAACAWIFSRGRRLGPPSERVRELPPSRRRYVDAVATSLARTRQRSAALAPVRREIRQGISRRAGLPSQASEADLRRAAVGLGIDEADVRAAFAPDPDDTALLAAGRLLAELEKGHR